MMKATSRPTQMQGRFYYETGRTNTINNGGLSVIPAAYAWESGSFVSGTPCLVSSISIVIRENAQEVPLYVLVFDVPANSPAVIAAVTTDTIGAARYTLGPLGAGDTLAHDFEEYWLLRECGDLRLQQGAPFDNGCLLIVSTTPNLHTDPSGPSTLMKATVRGVLL